MFNKDVAEKRQHHPNCLMEGFCPSCRKVVETIHSKTAFRPGFNSVCAECPTCGAAVQVQPKAGQEEGESRRIKPPKDLMASFQWALENVQEKYRDRQGNVICYHCLAILKHVEKGDTLPHKLECPYIKASQVLAEYGGHL